MPDIISAITAKGAFKTAYHGIGGRWCEVFAAVFTAGA